MANNTEDGNDEKKKSTIYIRIGADDGLERIFSLLEEEMPALSRNAIVRLAIQEFYDRRHKKAAEEENTEG